MISNKLEQEQPPAMIHTLLVWIINACVAISLINWSIIIWELVIYCTPDTEPMWWRILSVPLRFIPESILVATYIFWFWYLSTEPKSPLHFLGELLLTGNSIWHLCELSLEITFRFGVLEQGSYFYRIVSMMREYPSEIGIPIFALLGCFIYGSVSYSHFCKYKSTHDRNNL